jgi:hypothetical protein
MHVINYNLKLFWNCYAHIVYGKYLFIYLGVLNILSPLIGPLMNPWLLLTKCYNLKFILNLGENKI